MTEFRTIIIDDEMPSRRRLKTLLQEHCPQVKLVGEAHDYFSGVNIIEQESPDLVFLDINMREYSGFKLIKHFAPASFQFVFATAQDQHAIKAFKVGATGYLVKPIKIAALTRVIEKVVERAEKKTNHAAATHPKYAEINPKHRIVLPTKNGTIYLSINEIIYLQAAGRNTHIFLKNNQNVLTTLALKKCEEHFTKTTLLRIHKSNMINLAYLKMYVKKLDTCVEMEGGKKLDVGQSYKENLNKAVSFFAK